MAHLELVILPANVEQVATLGMVLTVFQLVPLTAVRHTETRRAIEQFPLKKNKVQDIKNPANIGRLILL